MGRVRYYVCVGSVRGSVWEERESWEERELCGRGPKAGARVKSVWVEMSGGCRPVCGTQSRPKEGGKRVGSGITRVSEVSEQGRGKGAQAAARKQARAKGWAGLEAGVGVDCELWGCGGRRASHPPGCAQSRRRRARSTRHTMGRARAHEREAARTLRSGFGEFGCPPPRTQVPTHTPAARLLPAHPALSRRAPDHAAAARGQQGVRRGRATGPCDHLRPKADN